MPRSTASVTHPEYLVAARSQQQQNSPGRRGSETKNEKSSRVDVKDEGGGKFSVDGRPENSEANHSEGSSRPKENDKNGNSAKSSKRTTENGGIARVHESMRRGTIRRATTRTTTRRGENEDEASTSISTRRSILRENLVTSSPCAVGEANFYPNRLFLRLAKLWTRSSPSRERRTIIFADASKDSLESIVTIIGTTRPLKSALRSGGSIRSGNSSSVRFSLPPEVSRPKVERPIGNLRIGSWNFLYQIADHTNADDRGAPTNLRSFGRTRFCKIVLCFALGVVVPSFLIVPVLVYVDDSNK